MYWKSDESGLRSHCAVEGQINVSRSLNFSGVSSTSHPLSLLPEPKAYEKKNCVNLPTIKKQSNGLSSVFQTLTEDRLTETMCLS